MTQQITTPFFPLHIRRSDGKQTIVQKTSSIKNCPSTQQLDRTPNAQGVADYYRLIDYDEPKHLDWRKKLGGLLLREIGGSKYEDKWQTCLLYDLPEGYRLYEHIKSKADGQNKAVKNHSGGGHDRQDAYLYGHPKGPKKRFRSPVEFFPHLLWLATDETGDPENCTCKLCSPYQLDQEKPIAPPAQQTQRSPSVQALPRRPSEPAMSAGPTPKPAATPAPAPSPAVSQPSTPAASLLPQPRSVDQMVDSQYGKFLIRVGEVIWHEIDPPLSRIGVVVRRWVTKDGSNRRVYQILPLSHPYDNKTPELVYDEASLKPWLTKSPPVTYNCGFLQQNSAIHFSQVPWDGIIKSTPNPEIPQIDASILAAKAVDGTYTLFEQVTAPAGTRHEERHWNGIYFGAEKIWTGDPVRIHVGSGNDILVVHSIVERIPPSHQIPPRAQVSFTGDIYTYAEFPAPDPNALPTPPANPHLPSRMREDMRWRNEYLVPKRRRLGYWKLVAPNQRVDIADVQSRWYEFSLFFAELYKLAVDEGIEPGPWMNARGRSIRLAREPGHRTNGRVEAFGPSVPRGTQFVDGLEPPPPPPQQQQQGQNGPAVQMRGAQPMDLSEPAFDDLLNLEQFGDD
ncbi:hypothetical protein M011DRAFT_387503, partial [Sporormia fimetaria CBS 119925]